MTEILSREEVEEMSIGAATVALIKALSSALVLSERARKKPGICTCVFGSRGERAEDAKCKQHRTIRAADAALAPLREKGWCPDD